MWSRALRKRWYHGNQDLWRARLGWPRTSYFEVWSPSYRSPQRGPSKSGFHGPTLFLKAQNHIENRHNAHIAKHGIRRNLSCRLPKPPPTEFEQHFHGAVILRWATTDPVIQVSLWLSVRRTRWAHQIVKRYISARASFKRGLNTRVENLNLRPIKGSACEAHVFGALNRSWESKTGSAMLELKN